MVKPEYIIWIFTATCNLDCLHCYTYRFRGLRELSLQEKLKLAKDIGENGIKYVNLTGGEPLIHSHLPQVLLMLHEYNVEKSIVTNATLVRDNIVELLYKTDTRIFATIEGPREVHDKIRGHGSYDLANRGIEVLRKKLSDISIVATVNRINYKRVHEIIDYVVSIDINELALLPVMPSGKALQTRIYVSAGEYLEAIENAWIRAREYGLRLSAWCTPWAPLLKRDIGFWFCREMSGMDIDPEGNVLLCDILDFKITSVRDKSVIEAFEEYRKHQLVRVVNTPPKLPGVCLKCPILQGCRGGCYARAYILKHDLNAGDPLCPRISISGK
ncbi:MAG: radical SAM protein [Desulfurococcaceae archaeon]|nr:radical SAM protein [Desulfurococcaceae archaeon]